MDAVVEDEVSDEIAEALAPAELLPPGIQQPVNIVDGRPELILPNDHTSFPECAEQCFQEMAKTKRLFRQGGILVQLKIRFRSSGAACCFRENWCGVACGDRLFGWIFLQIGNVVVVKFWSLVERPLVFAEHVPRQRSKCTKMTVFGPEFGPELDRDFREELG